MSFFQPFSGERRFSPDLLTSLSVHLSMVGDDAAVVAVEGELDISTAAVLEAMLMPLPGGGVRHVVVAADRLRFCDVRGFRTLAGMQTVLTATNGGLAIAGAGPALRRLVHLIQGATADPLVTPIPMYDTVADALRAERHRPRTRAAAWSRWLKSSTRRSTG